METKSYSEYTFETRSELKKYIITQSISLNNRLKPLAIIPHLKTIHSFIPNCKSDHLGELVYWIEHDLDEYPICLACGNIIYKFNGRTKGGYPCHCSKTCIAKSEQTKQKKEKTCLKRYGSKTVLQSNYFKQKSKLKCIKEHGVDNWAKTDLSKSAYNNTMRLKYDVDNYFERTDLMKQHYQDSLGSDNPFQNETVKRAIRKRCLEKYGKESYAQTKEFKESYIKTCIERYGVPNTWMLANHNCSSKKANLYFEYIYDQLHEDDQDEVQTSFLNTEFFLYDNQLNKSYFYDFVCHSLKICIEFQGDYWHMNPKIYGPMDWNESKNKFAFEIWEYDKRKREIIEEQGYNVTYVWESDIK